MDRPDPCHVPEIWGNKDNGLLGFDELGWHAVIEACYGVVIRGKVASIACSVLVSEVGRSELRLMVSLLV